MNKNHVYKKICHFLAEIGVLKRQARTGPKLAGVATDETIANHVTRAAQLAYILAELEGADPEKTACMVLFHDNGEVRVGDQHKVASRYFDINQAEKAAYIEQVDQLPRKTSQKLKNYYQEFENRNTLEGIVAKDADWLENAITVKEMMEQGGHKDLQVWIENVKKALETESAKKILRIIEAQESFTTSWWQGLKKMTYEKLSSKKKKSLEK